jgi:hypothetical protein
MGDVIKRFANDRDHTRLANFEVFRCFETEAHRSRDSVLLIGRPDAALFCCITNPPTTLQHDFKVSGQEELMVCLLSG